MLNNQNNKVIDLIQLSSNHNAICEIKLLNNIKKKI